MNTHTKKIIAGVVGGIALTGGVLFFGAGEIKETPDVKNFDDAKALMESGKTGEIIVSEDTPLYVKRYLWYKEREKGNINIKIVK